MGAFGGCILLAAVLATAIRFGIEPYLMKMCEELKRIADALESKDKK